MLKIKSEQNIRKPVKLDDSRQMNFTGVELLITHRSSSDEGKGVSKLKCGQRWQKSLFEDAHQHLKSDDNSSKQMEFASSIYVKSF